MTNTPQIVDIHGQPIRREELLTSLEDSMASLTGVVPNFAADTVASTIDPARLRALMQGAAEGQLRDYLTLAEEMEERDCHYGSVLGTRKRAVSGLPVHVEPAGETALDVEIANAVRALTEAPEFGELVDDLLDGLGKGFAVVEPLWRYSRSSGRLEPGSYEWRDPRWFAYDQDTGRRLMLQDGAGQLHEIPPGKAIIHRPKLKSGLPVRAGLARLVAVAYMCKSYALKDWLRYAELFGMPLRIGRYGPGAKKDDIAVLRRAVAQLATDAAAVLPQGMAIEFQQIANATGGADLFRGLAEWLDKQISKAVLGQTMTADDGSSQAQANVHNEVRGDILLSDAKQLATTINRDLVRVFVDLNWGPQARYPVVRLFQPESEDLKALADALTPFIDRGLRVDQSVILERFNLSAPADGAQLLQPQGQQQAAALPVPALNQQQACQCGQCHTARNAEQRPAADAIDVLVQDNLSEWEPVMRPMLDPVMAAATEADDFEAFRAMLPDLLEQMDGQALVEALAKAAFQARGQGNAGVDQ